MSPWLLFLAGLACAAAGGDLFERGLVGLAKWLRVAPGIIGATVAAFATSSPEISVAISSATAGKPEISFGNVLGCNVVNIAFVLGLVSTLGGMHAPRHSIRTDFPVAIGLPLLTLALAMDGTISRFDGIMLLLGFAVWLKLTVRQARRDRDLSAETIGERNHARIVVFTALGFVLLVAAGQLVVLGAVGVGRIFDIDTFIIGATMVAIGTSTPELTTALISKLRGRSEVGLGTLIGSNIFNGLFVVGLAATIHPIAIDREAVTFGLCVALAAIFVAYPWRKDRVSRTQGMALVGIYAAYVWALLALHS